MKKLQLIQLGITLIVLAGSMESCRIIGDIFKAGVWVGVLIVVGIIALILYFIGRSSK